MLRELHTRFGKNRLGAFWLLGEPLLGVFLTAFVFGSRHTLTGGVDSAGFIVAGLVAWGLVRNLFTHVQSAAEANSGLFAYRQVRPLATMAARVLLESGLSLVVYLTLLGLLAWCGHQAGVPKPLELLGCWSLLTAIGTGFGLLLAALQTILPSLARATNLALRPLMWISAVFVSISSLPADWQVFVLWNPIAHAIELLRVQQFGASYSTIANVHWPLYCSFALITGGLLAYNATWRRMVAS